MSDARDEAAKRYVHPLDATPLTTTADRRVEDFKAGWDAALAARKGKTP